jgi:hypothetical protein
MPPNPVGSDIGGCSSASGAAAPGWLVTGLSITPGVGSIGETWPGLSASWLPQRVRAMCSPSVNTCSPARSAIGLRVQNTELPIR